MPKTLYHGTLIHSLSLTQLETVPSALLCVDDEGVIEWIERDVDMSRWRKVAEGYGLRVGEKEEDQVTVVRLGQGEFLCPGFVDTHTVGHSVAFLSFSLSSRRLSPVLCSANSRSPEVAVFDLLCPLSFLVATFPFTDLDGVLS